MIRHISPGSERWLTFAESKLADLSRLRVKLGLPVLSRAYVPQAGTLIWISARKWGDIIRITGGATGRYYLHRIEVEGVGFVDVDPRYYLLQGGKLVQYAESPGAPDIAGSFSMDGKTLAYANAGDVEIRRQRRAPQTIAGAVMVPPTLAHFSPGSWFSTSLDQSPGVSEDGKHVFVMTGGLPQVYRLSAAQQAQEEEVALRADGIVRKLKESEWTGATEFDLVSSDFPPEVTAYYSGSHTMVPTVTASAVGHLSYRLDVGFGGTGLAQGVVRAAHDPFTDRPALLFTLPRSTGVDGSGLHAMSVRWWLFTYDYATETWESVWIRDVAAAYRGGFGDLQGSPLAGGFLVENAIGGMHLSSVPEIASGEDGVGVLYLQHDVDVTVHPTNYIATTWERGGGNTALLLNDTVLASDLPPAFEYLAEDINTEFAGARVAAVQLRDFLTFGASGTPCSAHASEGTVLRYAHFDSIEPDAVPPFEPFPADAGDYWVRPGAATTHLGPEEENYFLSPRGDRLHWDNKYYEDGALVFDGTSTFFGRWSYERNVVRSSSSEISFPGGVFSDAFFPGALAEVAVRTRGPLEEDQPVGPTFTVRQNELLTDEFKPHTGSTFP